MKAVVNNKSTITNLTLDIYRYEKGIRVQIGTSGYGTNCTFWNYGNYHITRFERFILKLLVNKIVKRIQR